jgi:16S rRNA (cytosine967-C5)-methyltransferase
MKPTQSHPRDLAVRVLTRVLSDRQTLDVALASVSGEIDGESRAWLQEVCSGTLRWKGRVDQLLDSVALKKKPSGWLRKMLSLAVYQLIAQDRVNPARVVSETVSWVKSKEGDAPARFANALLRKASEHAQAWRNAPIESAASASLPDWLWERMRKQRGEAWTKQFAAACLERPTLWVSVKPGSKLMDSGLKAGPVPGSYCVGPDLPPLGSIPNWPGFSDGQFFVQDISSQTLVAEIADQVRRGMGKSSGLRALDLCAAPGGKSAGLAWQGFEVAATDREEGRLSLLRQTVARVAAEKVEVVAREKITVLPPVDLAWVDAPCTGSGILRRHPDVRWLRRESELESLRSTQLALIREAWGKVREGGYLAYSVCSVLEEEGAARVKQAELAGAAEIQTWMLAPQDPPGGDGFWAVLLRKT